ncbi:MAG: VWA domain-containing protein, partial [Immundisolibacteraceae bacterium]|nr:VWA domain-containing protein [Immundisolibacteraceae bacterium]
MNHQALKTFILSLFLTFSYGSAVFADDTDIYLGDQVNVIRPNLLFVLDTSDSMNAKVTGTSTSRLQNMREAMHDIVLGLDNINVGLMRFNGRRSGDNQTPT